MKIFIIGSSDSKNAEISKKVCERCGLKMGSRFSTDISLKSSPKLGMYYLDMPTVSMSYKNSSIMSISTCDEISEGITFDDFEIYDVFNMDFKQYNMAADYLFSKYDIITIWVDSKDHDDNAVSIEAKYVNERISNDAKYMYFLDEDESTIVDDITRYASGDIAVKKSLIIKNS